MLNWLISWSISNLIPQLMVRLCPKLFSCLLIVDLCLRKQILLLSK
jgi:hypothetical protein